MDSVSSLDVFLTMDLCSSRAVFICPPWSVLFCLGIALRLLDIVIHIENILQTEPTRLICKVSQTFCIHIVHSFIKRDGAAAFELFIAGRQSGAQSFRREAGARVVLLKYSILVFLLHSFGL